MSRIKIEMVGRKFGKLTVLKEDGKTKKELKYYCECDCGNFITRVGYALRHGTATSCGCGRKEINVTHGMTDTRIYRIWKHILSRCINKNAHAYSDYGGRGIVICDEWKNNFKVFYEWSINNNYKDILTIDRIDNNGNYEPNNCRWATSIEQANNKRNNVLVDYMGEYITLRSLSIKTGITYNILAHRYYRNKPLIN